jgi:hypothetical protein
MKPYGSKRSFDTEPRIKNARALVKREGEAEIEAQVNSAKLREALDEIAMNAENLLKGGLPHFSREEFADTVAFRARHALSPVLLQSVKDK